ncbi:hypothetical protein J4E91_003019 [Alternaria rosae]|nr:hypothetical protein J4E91_003019 [Alternaria rosae]
MSMQTSASVPDQQDDAMPDLPPMGQFIATMDRSVQYSEQLPKTCSICWEDFNWDDSVVIRLPCDHIFHEECCLNCVNSTLGNRNACPMCRTVFCLHNVLTLEREDSMSDSEEGYSSEVMTPYDRVREAYHWIHAAANDLYEEEWWKETGSPVYVSIIRETRIQWHHEHHHQPYEFICDEHEEIGDSWLEFVVANRVRERFSEAGLADSLEGQAVERRRNQLVSWVNQDSDPESEVWVPQNM